MRGKREIVCCAVSLAFVWGVALADEQTGAITGSVRDSSATPLAGVTITVRGAADRVATTGPDGRFEFQGLPEGEYGLDAVLKGFGPVRRTLRIEPGGPVTISLTLLVSVRYEVVVTATKTGEADVQTTPMAITVLPGGELARMEARSVAQIAGLAPAVTFSQTADWAQLTIRGIGTDAVFAGSDPSSAVYVDGVYLARPAMVLADFLDLERVEVLRGPQGTLYGRNVIGGALNLISRPPADELEASVRAAVGNDHTLRAEGRMSGPLKRGKLTGSAAFLRGVRDGFVRDLDHPDHPLGGDDVTALRGQLRLALNGRSDLLVSTDMTRQEGTPLIWAKVLQAKPGIQIDNPADLHEVRTSTLGESRNLQYGASARLSVGLTPATRLTSLTAFRSVDYEVLADTDITELELTASHFHERQHQISEEITVSHTDSRLTWLLGTFLFHEIDRQPSAVRLGGPRLEFQLNPEVEADSIALFGQTTFHFNERLAATAGLRHGREQKAIDNAGRIQPIDGPPEALPGTAYDYSDEISDTPWTPKLGLEMRIREDTLAYLSATRGYKSGGFNLTSTETGRGYAPEWAWTYEGGLKTLAAGGRARLNLSVFHTDYTDLQVSVGIRPGVIDISNAADATIRGAEMEATAELTSSVQAGGHLAWLATRYERYIALGAGSVVADVAGNRLNNAPEWSGRAWIAWNHGIGRASSLSVRADATWQSTVYFSPFNDAIERQTPYGLLHANAEFWAPGGRWSVSTYARNLMNKDYITGSFSTAVTAYGGRPGEPRQFGVRFTIRR
jgi:iron complex outermembrane receptor protein